MPEWLNTLAWISIALGLLCAAWIVIDITRGYRQKMAIMNIVWPITALYAGPLAIWGYLHVARLRTARGQREARERGEPTAPPDSMLRSVALAATHCGSGCTLADVLVESSLAAAPLTLFGSEVAASWTLDFVAAFVIGIVFQYFSMRPMSDAPAMRVLRDAIKADALSLTSWQIGMYGWMAIAIFGLFDGHLDKAGPVFWFMMQLAMLAGFATAAPVNAWLIRRGIKERM